MDEILAVSAARQSSLAGVWRVLWAGTDLSPPLYHFLLHGLARGTGVWGSALVWRMPSIIGVYAAGLTAYILVRRYLSPFVALLVCGMVLASNLFNYAIQVREYGLLTFGLAGLLLIWDRFQNASFPALYALALWFVASLCLSLHFYGFVGAAAIGVAECIWLINTRNIRWGIWASLLLTIPVEAAWAPYAFHLANFNATDNKGVAYFGHPTLGRFADAFCSMVLGGKTGVVLLVSAIVIMVAIVVLRQIPIFKTLLRGEDDPKTFVAVSANWSSPAMLIAALATLPFAVFAVRGSLSERYTAPAALFFGVAGGYIIFKTLLHCEDAKTSVTASADWSPLEILIAALGALPFAVFAFSFFVTNTFSERYTAPAALFFGVAGGYLLDKHPLRRIVAVALLPILIFILALEVHKVDPIAVIVEDLRAPLLPLPIVVANGRDYINIMNAVDESTQKSLLFLLNPPDFVSPDPTNENAVKRLASFRPEYCVQDREEFLSTKSDFYVLITPEHPISTFSPWLLSDELERDVVKRGRDGMFIMRVSVQHHIR